jgi:hypothetical protein
MGAPPGLHVFRPSSPVVANANIHVTKTNTIAFVLSEIAVTAN